MLVKKLCARLQNHPKRLIYAEGEDIRVLQSARQFATRKLGVPILVGEREKIESAAKSADIRLDGIKIVEPSQSDDYGTILRLFQGLPKFKGFEPEEIISIAKNPLYFATMMLATGRADAMVAGAQSATSSALRPIMQIIPVQKGFTTVSSMMVASTSHPDIGVNGDIFLADCGVIPEPTEEQLCDIAITTAMLMSHFTLETPKVAMLSYVSKLQDSKLQSVMKVKSATALAHAKILRRNLNIEIDGELQVDTAIRPEAAEARGIRSSVAGRANVLIFPDLNAGNIASKMLQVASTANCYGQILTGLVKPVAEVSRGATVNDIFGTSVIVAAQAVDRRFISLEEV